MTFLFLVLPSLIVAYVMILRPLLHRIPAFAKFYADADGFWEKVWALCGNSLTMMWGHILTLGGISLGVLDYVAPLVGDPDLKAQVQSILQPLVSNPKYGGAVVIAVGIITMAVRLRGLLKA